MEGSDQNQIVGDLGGKGWEFSNFFADDLSELSKRLLISKAVFPSAPQR